MFIFLFANLYCRLSKRIGELERTLEEREKIIKGLEDS